MYSSDLLFMKLLVISLCRVFMKNMLFFYLGKLVIDIFRIY